MMPALKDQRKKPRIPVNLFLHIFNEERIAVGNAVDLSTWGIRFRTLVKLEQGDLVKLSFMFKTSFVLNTKIVQKLPDNEYRGIFIFDDYNKKLALDLTIERELDRR